jgi:hypothetical protein
MGTVLVQIEYREHLPMRSSPRWAYPSLDVRAATSPNASRKANAVTMILRIVIVSPHLRTPLLEHNKSCRSPHRDIAQTGKKAHSLQ